VEALHGDGQRARRTGRRFILAARLLAAAAVLLGLSAGASLWWRADPAGQQRAVVVGGAALSLGVLWVVVLWRAARWLNHGVVADHGSEPKVPAGLMPDHRDDPAWLWDTLRLAHLVLLGIPLAGLLFGLGSATPTSEGPALRFGTAWWLGTGVCLLMTSIIGGLVGGVAFGVVYSEKECWTARGAVRRLLVYAVPFLLAAPWLAGLRDHWTGTCVAAAMVWLLIAPVMHVEKHIPGGSSPD
jgi:hypothetical protein